MAHYLSLKLLPFFLNTFPFLLGRLGGFPPDFCTVRREISSEEDPGSTHSNKLWSISQFHQHFRAVLLSFDKTIHVVLEMPLGLLVRWSVNCTMTSDVHVNDLLNFEAIGVS